MEGVKSVAKSLVPEIRFEGFSEEWVDRLLGDKFNLENGFAFKSKYFKEKLTNVIVLTPGSVKIGGGFQGDKGQFYDIEKEVPQRYVLKAGDIFITMTDLTPTAQALGFPAIVPKDENVYLHNQRLGKLVGFTGDLQFLFHSLCTEEKQKEIVSTASGTTVKHTSPSKFLNRYGFFPKKLEQTKIGQYFQQLDTLITQHQQKHEKLINLKQSLLEKMFPQHGADEPAIRFKEFSGSWEEKELGEILDITSAARVHKDEWTNAGVPFFRTSDVVSIHKGLENKKAFISFELYKNLSNKIGCVKKDDLLITGGGSIGIPYLIKTDEPLYFKDADLLWIKSSSKISGYFLFSFFFSQLFRKHISSITHIGTISHYTIEQAKATPISTSCDEEQTKIGNLFQQLDTLIALHQTQLKKLGNIKQACLSKLFV